jgi:tetratricopeptide (TPR) repeat protein
MKRALLGLVLALATGCAAAAPLPPKAVQLNQDGAAALAAGDLQTAEARLSLAIEYNPRFTEAWVNLGLVALAQNNYPTAEKDFLEARRLNPDLATPHHALGLLAEARGDAAGAEKFYRAALKVDPGFAAARANLGRRLYARGAWEDAREQFLRLTEVAPETLQGWAGLVECLLRLQRETEADEVLARAREGFGDAPELGVLVARQLLRRGAFAQAEEALAPLTNSTDRSRAGAAWAWTAVARESQGNHDAAIQAANESLKIDAGDLVANYALGTALAAKGDKASKKYLALIKK